MSHLFVTLWLSRHFANYHKTKVYVFLIEGKVKEKFTCPEIKGHAIETGRMTCKIILYTESMGGLFVLGIILFLL